MKVRRLNYGQGGNTQEVEKKDDELLFDRLIYRKLGSLTDNKVMTIPAKPDSDFKRFLLDMNNLHIHKYYTGLVDGLPLPTPDIIALDEYLGTLGITEDYPFLDDTQEIPLWFDGVDTNKQRRILVDGTDNTFLVQGNYVLVVTT